MRVEVICIVLVTVVAAVAEKAWLREKSSDKRGLSSSSLEFDLKRSKGVTKLKLQENRRVNVNAPVFELQTDNKGRQTLVKKKGIPKLKTKFYVDKKHSGSFKVTEDKTDKRPIISGSVQLDDGWYDVSSVPTLLPSPITTRDTPFMITKHKENRHPKMKSNRRTEHPVKPVDDSSKERPIKSLLTRIQRLLDDKSKRKSQRSKRSSPVHAVEILVVVDQSTWADFYATTIATGELSREDATELTLREHFVHIVTGMSLRYESIDDPDMNIYLTVRGFLFFKTSDSPLLVSMTPIESEDGMLVDANVYLNDIFDWAVGVEGLDHTDHMMVFTHYNLYTDDSGTSVAGLAYVNGTCRSSRVSVTEDSAHFRSVSVGAHELGHNLGSRHDGGSSSADCDPLDKYVMAPSVANFQQDEAYTANPWTFSTCSIEAFKAYIGSLGGENCLLDAGEYYDDVEHNAHLQLLPGQLHTAEEQCKMTRGPESFVCTSITPSTGGDYCRRLACFEPDDDLCYIYTPARGTDCGETGSNMYCIDGQCVQKSDEHIQQAQDGVTGQTPAATTTAEPGTTTDGNIGSGGDSGTCEDTGYLDYSCEWLDDYFTTNLNATAELWCLDPNWEARCCIYCRDAQAMMPEPTTTTTDTSTTPTTSTTTSIPTTTTTTTTATTTTTTIPTTTTTTTASTTTTTTEASPTTFEQCIDVGWTAGGWSCGKVSDYFLATYDVTPTYWCWDPNWKAACCLFCAAYGI